MLGSIYQKCLIEFIDALNDCIEKGRYRINVKRLREFTNVKSDNRSTINMYWRFLKTMHLKGHIARIDNRRHHKTYLLPSEMFSISQIINEVEEDLAFKKTTP